MLKLIYQKTKSLSFPNWSIPIGLFFVNFMAFGLLIPWLGFYWDDLPMAWFLNTLGPSSFPEVWEAFRPVMGWIFWLTTSLLGNVPWHWQVFGLITRWLSVVALWWALRQLWPKHTFQVTLVAFLFAIYPGFQQQSISLIYSNYFLVMTFFHLSLGSMIWAIRSNRFVWQLTITSLISGAISLFSLEFFFGLELIRPFLLWMVLGEVESSPSRRFRRVLSLWLPFLILILVFIPWRVFAVEFKAYDPELFFDFAENAWMSFLTLLQTIIVDLYEVNLLAWSKTFQFPDITEFGLKSMLAFWGIIAITSSVVIVYLSKIELEPRSHEKGHPSGWRSWSKSAIILGVVSLLIGGWPFWIPKLDLKLAFPWDRFTLGMMLGACLLFVGVLDSFVKKRIWKLIVIGIVVGVATGTHFQAANSFRRAWDYQRRFYWQLTWRIPGLEPGTLILANEIPIDYVTDNSLTGPINWIYAPQHNSRDMPYMLYDVDKRLGLGLKGLEEGLPVFQPYRAASFTGSTSQVLVIHYLPPGCLRIVDQYLDDSSPIMPVGLRPAVYLSRLELIDVNADPPAQLPEPLMGPEPIGTWCYYYQKADLARQMKEWQKVAELGEEAFNQPDKPNQAEERIPFIEGYGHVGQWDRARQLSIEALDHSDGTIWRPLCHVWERLEESAEISVEGEEVIREVNEYLGCAALSINN
jgi:hypothetical protein